jgi:hypothetical protein
MPGYSNQTAAKMKKLVLVIGIIVAALTLTTVSTKAIHAEIIRIPAIANR